MRVASPTVKTLGQRNQGFTRRYSGSRIEQDGASKRVLNADTGGAGEDVPPAGPAIAEKCVIAGILGKQAAKVSFGAKMAGSNSTFYCGVVAKRAGQVVIPPAANE